MKRYRIIETEDLQGNKTCIIQQKHFLFWWIWVDAWIDSNAGADCKDTFQTQEEALDNLPN